MLTSDCSVTVQQQSQIDEKLAEEEELQKMFLVLPYEHFELDPEDAEVARVQKSHIGWIVLYAFLVIYMFAALAIVCDEFFVPALEKYVDEFQISLDVAGATFMAAGGSMPELFTSLIATMQDSSEVGFAAIVGSAVFNVLFVIAVCAIFNSADEMVLDWWPVLRDCSWYILALATVVFVFGISSPKDIEWWEAILLLSEYVGYCTFMKFNAQVHGWVEMKFLKLSRVQPTQGDPEHPEHKVGDSIMPVRHEGRILSRRMDRPRMFRQSIVQLLTQNTYLYETAGIAAVTEIKGDLEETFKTLDVDNSGLLGADEIRLLLEKMGHKKLDTSAVETALRRIVRNGKGEMTFEAFKSWYIASEARITVEVHRVFDKFDSNQNQRIELDEIFAMLKSLGHRLDDLDKQSVLKEVQEYAKMSDDELSKTASSDSTAAKSEATFPATPSTAAAPSLLHVDSDPNTTLKYKVDATKATKEAGEEDGDITYLTFPQFEAWYTNSLFYKNKEKHNAMEEKAEEEAYMTLDMPEELTPSTVFWWAFTYPICALLYITLPDVRHPKYNGDSSPITLWKVAVMEFSFSLFWIGLFSLVLYESTLAVSNTIGIPLPIAAVTVLAAGTSVPDLLSSYIVARQGEADMAVSSSIGSNIFDVTVGLPLPWLIYNIVFWKPVAVTTDSLGFSVLLLIVMLAAVLITIKCCRWRMTKSLGYVMLVLYVVFLAQELCNQLLDFNTGF